MLKNNEKFRKTILKGIIEGKISGFSEELWNKLKEQNIRAPGINDFTEIFRDGYNQGYCTVCSKQLSYSLISCNICGGTLPILTGTINCPKGDHTWIENDNYIIDTTLMLIIDKTYINEIGYELDNKYNPNIRTPYYDNSSYLAAKDYATDKSIKRH